MSKFSQTLYFRTPPRRLALYKGKQSATTAVGLHLVILQLSKKIDLFLAAQECMSLDKNIRKITSY
jgi:hypothetical protein